MTDAATDEARFTTIVEYVSPAQSDEVHQWSLSDRDFVWQAPACRWLTATQEAMTRLQQSVKWCNLTMPDRTILTRDRVALHCLAAQSGTVRTLWAEMRSTVMCSWKSTSSALYASRRAFIARSSACHTISISTSQYTAQGINICGLEIPQQCYLHHLCCNKNRWLLLQDTSYQAVVHSVFLRL